MKPAAFAYRQVTRIAEAIEALAGNRDAKLMAGGQTLGPMLNLRLAQPALIIDITRIAELGHADPDGDDVTFGAVVTHAAIEDRRTPDPTGGFLARVAGGIAYRAVRTRGTIGGSLAHADPAADWMTCLTMLGADITIATGAGRRRVPLRGFMRGALDTGIGQAELLQAVHVPKYSARARFGYNKFCRKDGEFADSIGAALSDPDRGIFRLVSSTAAGAPIVIEGQAPFYAADIPRLLDEAGGTGDGYERRLRAVVLERAHSQTLAT